MILAVEVDPNHLFFWEPIAFEGTPFEFNRVTLLMLFAAAVCSLFFVAAARRTSLVPRGLQNLAETGYLFVRNNIAIDVIGPEGTKYANYLATVFFFIFFSNLLEIVPGINFPVTSRMAIPFLLAILTWIIFNFVGLKKQGVRYITGTLFPPGVPKPVYIILAPIELFSVFLIRPLTLAVRLLANMMAGHVLLTIFFIFTHDYLWNGVDFTAPLGLVTLAVTCALILFELLVISIQAYIFTLLTAFYIAESIHGHGAEDTHVDADQVPTRHETEGLAEARA